MPGEMTFEDCLSSMELDVLTKRGTSVSFEVGDRIMRQGDEGDHVFLLREGLVKVIRTDRDGTTRMWGVRGPGELLGEMSCLDGHPRSATIKAATIRISGFRIGRADFLAYVNEFPRVAVAVSRQVSRRLRSAEDAYMSHTTDSANARVLRALVTMCGLFRRWSGARKLIIPLSQTELSQLAALSHVATHRSLAELRRQSLIATGHRRVIVPCVVCLHRAAGKIRTNSSRDVAATAVSLHREHLPIRHSRGSHERSGPSVHPSYR